MDPGRGKTGTDSYLKVLKAGTQGKNLEVLRLLRGVLDWTGLQALLLLAIPQY